MNRRNFLRMLCWLPFVKVPNLVDRVDYGTDSPLDDVEGFKTHLAWDGLTGRWETYVCPTEVRELAPLTVFDKDVFSEDADAWGSLREAWTVPPDEWINLEVTHLPTGDDELSVRFPYGTINLGKLPPEATVSWWVEPRKPHTVSWFIEPWKPYIIGRSRHKGTLEIPLDGKKHFVAVCFENGIAVKAYLDNNMVWTNRMEEEA